MKSSILRLAAGLAFSAALVFAQGLPQQAPTTPPTFPTDQRVPSSHPGNTQPGANPDESGARVSTDDQTLTAQAKDKLSANPDLSNVQVVVADRIAILTGTVPNKAAKKEAHDLMKQVAGVRSIRNDITVSSSSSTNSGASNSASSTSTSRSEAERSNAEAAGEQGSTATQPSTGSGQTQPSSQQPESTQSRSSGQSQGAIPSQKLPQSDIGTSSSDIQSQIELGLQKQPGLANSSVAVNVTDSTVELSGTVANRKDKQTAERVAQSYAGNRKIIDRINVSGPESAPHQ